MGKGKGKGKGKSKGKGKGKGKATLASRAELHRLYEAAVQSPEADVEFFDEVFRNTRGRAPMRFREDFCGTATLSAHWCRSHPERSAVGVDLDGPTLRWGEQHNLEDVAERVELIEADVLGAPMPKDGVGADVSCAMNFSFCVFKTREALREYLVAAYRTLAPGGLFFMEMFGGHEAHQEVEEERELEGFDYRWEQVRFNPITNEILCHIHFEFPDGSKIERAFTYDWRVWSLPELRELLLEAGFERVRVFWETVEEDEDDPDTLTGSGEYEEVEEVENQDSWLVYVVAERAPA